MWKGRGSVSEMAVVDDLHRRLAEECRVIFGTSYKVYREFNIARNQWEWIIFSKFIGMRARFDVGIPADTVGEPYALERLIAQLPDQMQCFIESHVAQDGMSVRDGFFAIDREDTTGIVNPGIVIYP